MKPCKRGNMARTLVMMYCKCGRGMDGVICSECALKNKLCEYCGYPLKVRHKDKG